jgi:hypothetical protein
VWKEKCEKYFHMYNIPIHVWVSFSTTNFRGNAELWFQTYEARHSILTWPELCVAVEHKFGRDLYHNYIRDLLAIMQTSDVLEYDNRFEQAKHRVLVHNKEIGEVFFVQKFLDGLKYNIKNALALHKPRIVDVALSLALMQEEILEASSRRFPSRPRDYSRSAVKFTTSTSPTTSPFADVGILPTVDKIHSAAPAKPKWDSKLAALQAQRRKLGLCMKCGDKWARNHTCPAHVPLHVVEELLDAIHVEDTDNEEDDSSNIDEEMLAISLAVAEGFQGRKTIKLQGLINKKEILILIDFGSSGTFISSTVAQQLGLPLEDAPPVKVTIADGAQLPCTKCVPQLFWWTQGHTFSTSARVLDMKCYDLLLGMEWLEQHSPMWVHWKRKKMRFTYKGTRITLLG